MYATVEDLTTEGLLDGQPSPERAARALAAASALIDAVTGQFFAPRTLAVSVLGRGGPSLWLQVPILRLDELTVLLAPDRPYTIDAAHLEVVGAPVMPGIDGPRITRLGGVFARGALVRVEGVWGYTEPDSSPFGHTPYAVWRACLLLAARVYLPLAGDPANDARLRARIIEEQTRDQSYRLADPMSADVVNLTGDPEIDLLLTPYLRRPGLGAA